MTRHAQLAKIALATLLALAAGCSERDDGAPEPDDQPCLESGAVGLEPGQVVPNVGLTDCAGGTVELRDLCPRRAAFVYAFASW